MKHKCSFFFVLCSSAFVLSFSDQCLRGVQPRINQQARRMVDLEMVGFPRDSMVDGGMTR